MTDTAVTVIAYGSLMSGYGLAGLQRLEVIEAFRLRLLGCRRGFGKQSQYGDRYAMVVDPLQPGEPIRAQRVPPGVGPMTGVGALALRLPLADFARVAMREGYQAKAVFSLAQSAAAAGCSLRRYLWDLLQVERSDYSGYRRALFRVLGYTSPHYIPHPVAVTGTGGASELAVIFLSPGQEGSGDPAVVPIRVQTGMTRVLSLPEAWRLKPNDSQLDYFLMCLLAEAHNVCVADVLADTDRDPDLVTRLRRLLATELPAERDRFRAVLGLAEHAYLAAFEPDGRPTVSRPLPA